MTILERELSNSDLIYIYWEQDGKWYAYEQSAFYLSQMMLRVSLGCYVMEDTLWLAKAEVDVSRIRTKILSATAKRNMYYIIPLTMDFMSGWLSKVISK